jgi:hypothetical protein
VRGTIRRVLRERARTWERLEASSGDALGVALLVLVGICEAALLAAAVWTAWRVG